MSKRKEQTAKTVELINALGLAVQLAVELGVSRVQVDEMLSAMWTKVLAMSGQKL